MKTFEVTKVITIIQRVTIEATDWESAEEQALLTTTMFKLISIGECSAALWGFALLCIITSLIY